MTKLSASHSIGFYHDFLATSRGPRDLAVSVFAHGEGKVEGLSAMSPKRFARDMPSEIWSMGESEALEHAWMRELVQQADEALLEKFTSIREGAE